MAGSAFLEFTPVERVALETILDDCPEILETLRAWLRPVIEDLSRSGQGLLATELQAEDFLSRLRREFVARLLAKTEPWGKDEGLRETVVDLLTRQILSEARPGFLQRVVGAKAN